MFWIIGIGGALGAAARFLLGNMMNKRKEKFSAFPLGTWLINMSGSFLLGLITQCYISNEIGDMLFYFAGAGFCGAFTTFSTFGYETINLIQKNKRKLAFVYFTSSIIVGVISAMVGFFLLKL